MIDNFASLKNISKKLEADIIIYNGIINMIDAERLINITKFPKNKNVLFCLCTQGGNPHAAFKIARQLQNKYTHFYLYVYGHCKSAGTLIAIGSDEIIMTDYAEFGPLDVQLQDKDEISKYSSGLNINQSLSILEGRVKHIFRTTLMELVNATGISTKTAAKLATELALGFISPIVSQIDPVRVGEIERAVSIALAYGERLTSKRGNLDPKDSSAGLVRLVQGYPNHGFVIDYEEAKEIFKNVRKPDVNEEAMGSYLKESYPPNDNLVKEIYPGEHNEQFNQRANATKATQDETNSGRTDSRDSGKILPVGKSNERITS